MEFLREEVKTVPVPTLYAYEMPGSARATLAGAAYMLIEGFYGNSLQDVHHTIYDLPVRYIPDPAGSMAIILICKDRDAGVHLRTVDDISSRTRRLRFSKDRLDLALYQGGRPYHRQDRHVLD